MQCSMPNSTAYQYACSTKRRPARRVKPPLHGAQGHAVQHAHQHGVPYACLIKRRPARRAKPPPHGAQEHAVRHAQQHGVPIRVPYEAALRVPRKADPKGGRGMQCSTPVKLQPKVRGVTRYGFAGATRPPQCTARTGVTAAQAPHPPPPRCDMALPLPERAATAGCAPHRAPPKGEALRAASAATHWQPRVWRGPRSGPRTGNDT